MCSQPYFNGLGHGINDTAKSINAMGRTNGIRLLTLEPWISQLRTNVSHLGRSLDFDMSVLMGVAKTSACDSLVHCMQRPLHGL